MKPGRPLGLVPPRAAVALAHGSFFSGDVQGRDLAAVAREMARDGDYLTPRLIQDGEKVPFLGKPPLHFWVTAGCVGLLGETELAYRLPSLLAAAFLTKGPIALAMVGLPIVGYAAMTRSLGFLGGVAWGRSVALFVLATAPWFVLAERAQPGFLHDFFVNENLLRYLVRDYGDRYGSGHIFPYGSAIWMFLIATLPWSLFLFRRRIWTGVPGGLPDPVARFSLAGSAASLLFLCFSRQLLVTYLLPLIPLYSIGLAIRLRSLGLDGPRLRVAAGICAVALAVATPAVLLADARSTREALAVAEAQACITGRTGGFCFPEGAPCSAWLYARDRIAARRSPNWPVELSEEAGAGSDLVYLVEAKHYQRLTEGLRSLLQPLEISQSWQIFVARKGASAAASAVRHPARVNTPPR